MVKKRNGLLCSLASFGVMPAVFLTACGNVQQTESDGAIEFGMITGETRQPEEMERMQEPSEPYQQMLLYIREGLYQHGVEGTYQAYFSAVEDECDGYYWRGRDWDAYGDAHFCEVLLEENGNYWSESVVYTYDAETGWYMFYGQYEPVLVGDPLSVMTAENDYVLDVMDNHVYTCQISGKMNLPFPMKYISENAPVEDDKYIDIPFSEAWRGASGASEEDRLSYGVYPRLYTYVDNRLDMYITIIYPEISLSGTYDDAEKQKMEDDINKLIKSAFFYGCGVDDSKLFNPREEIYGNIQRNYIITRRDENYFSIRIYEGSYYRGANHPNEWETAITLDMHSGRLLNLGDVAGGERTIGDLFGTGAFRCMWYWRDGNEEVIPEKYNEDYLARYKESTKKCSEYGSDFYITDRALGLITTESRYYTNVEADFADLGISGF